MDQNERMSGNRRGRMALVAVVLAGTLAGCKHRQTVAPPPSAAAIDVSSPTATISAEPMAIDVGQSVVLNWRTSNASDVSIDGIGPVNPNGTQSVTPSNSTSFHLVAKGEGGTTEANVRVTVRVPVAPTDTGNSNNLNGDMGSDAAFHAAVQDVYFGYDSYDLDDAGQTNTAAAASYMAQHPAVKITIGGYCDERGSAEYNLALGENRANAVRQAMVQAGIAPGRVRVVSYGKEKQFCTDAAESCYKENRRGQFNLDR